MPELPDVQVFKEYVDATSLHREIVGIEVDADDLRGTEPGRRLGPALTGQRLGATRRHGKHLFVRIDGASGTTGWLRLHFGMTGELQAWEAPDGATTQPKHTRLRLDFDDGRHLAYVNVRKLGQIELLDDPDAFIAEQGLGPDALDVDVDVDTFVERVGSRRGTIKGTLMNQEVIAGIGNEYADEILLEAGLHPEAEVPALDRDTLERLHAAARKVLPAAVEIQVDPDRFPDWLIIPNREEGAPCPSCGEPLRKIEVSGRPTYFCPRDQRLPGA